MVNKPKKYDAVLGGEINIPLYAGVLGGIEGLKIRRTSKVVEERIAAYEKALEYGDRGLDLAIEGLLDPAEEVIWYVYQMLQKRSEAKAKQALIEYTPYQLFECLETVRNPGNYYHAAVSYGDNYRTLLICTYREGTVYLDNYQSDGSNNFSYVITTYNSLDRIIFSQDGSILVVAKQNRGQNKSEIVIYSRLSSYSNNRVILRGHSLGKTRAPLADLPSAAREAALCDRKENIELKTIMSLAISPNIRYLVSGGGDSKIIIRSWNFFTGWRETYHLRAHKSPVTALAIDPESQILASGCYQGIIKLHKLKNVNLIGNIETNCCINALIFSRDGENLISGDLEGNIKIWQLKNLELLYILNAGDRVRSLNISTDGKFLIACVSKDDNHSIQIWDLSMGKKLATLKDRTNKLAISACMSRDGKTILSQSLFATHIWGLK